MIRTAAAPGARRYVDHRQPASPRPACATLDAERIHYEFIGVMGCTEAGHRRGVGPARNRSDLRGRRAADRRRGWAHGAHAPATCAGNAPPAAYRHRHQPSAARLQSLLDDFGPLAAGPGPPSHRPQPGG
ncbi:MAG: hypothetical protein R2851_05110 [Caldilineaceae bacterium]